MSYLTCSGRDGEIAWRNVKVWSTAVIALIGFLGISSLGHAEEPITNHSTTSLDSFDAYQPNSFPAHWVVRGDEATAKAVYSIAEEDGNRFLRAYADKQDVQIGISRAFEPEQFPALQWRWRVKQLPTGADERTEKTNDSAAAVYVVFDSTVMPRAIKYVWSSSLPVGTRIKSPVYWRSRVVVLQSGAARVGEWQQEVINYYQDYKDFFGEEPGKVIGIAVLTDSDATKSVAEAHYDDFSLLTAGAAEDARAKGTGVQLAPAMVSGR
jgi:hypothetical protein